MDHYITDPEVRFGASTIEDGQTFTTTLQDQENTHDPRNNPHERPHSVTYQVQVADLREQIAQQQVQITNLQEMMQQLTAIMQQQLTQNAPKPVQRKSPVPLPRPSPVAVHQRNFIPTPELDRWMDDMLHGERQRQARPRPSPRPVNIQSPAFQDLPASSSAFLPNLMSTKGPVHFQEGGGQVPSVFSPPFRPCPGPVPASNGDQGRRTILPEKYQGTSPLNEYLVHFELVQN